MAPLTAIICAVTVIISLWAFDNYRVYDRLLFRPSDILARKEFYRLASSGLIHADYFHLFFNMLSLASFAEAIERQYGGSFFAGIYLSSIVGGSLLSTFLHRHEDYCAVGASGGVCGIIFAYLFLFPGSRISLLFVPIGIPGWLFALVFVIISMIGIKKGGDGIGHDAHLGGALIGLGVTTIIFPQIIREQPFIYATVVGFSLSSLYFLIKKPVLRLKLPFKLFRDHPFQSNIRYQRYDEALDRAAYKEELDSLLDKMLQKGAKGLSKTERKRMEELSKLIHSSEG